MDNLQQTVLPVYSEEQLKEVFTQSFMHVYSNLSNEDGKEAEVMVFLSNLISNFNLYSRFTPDELPGLVNVVFDSDLLRDFILTFQAVFLGRWVQGRGSQVVNALAEDLARAISTDANLVVQPQGMGNTSNRQEDYCFIPTDVRQSLATYSDVVKIVKSNPWIICLLLFQQYLNIDILDKLADRNKPTKK